ncbi:MAG: hypothetical protein KC467_15380 [Marinomonas atlantica]|nr:hypothetical protein [Marinomonas atlantica]
MNNTFALIALPLVLSLAACSTDGYSYGSSLNNSDYSSNSSYSSSYGNDSKNSTYSKNEKKAISKYDTDWGTVWSTADGMTLYTFSKNQYDRSNCNAKCATIWPPHYAKKHAKTWGNFGVMKRNDGRYQWTVNGQPLYTYSKDTYAGETVGQGAFNYWYIARADDAPIKSYQQGEYDLLTDVNHMTLYTFDKDYEGVSNCNDGCAKAWPPLMAKEGAHTSGPFSIMQRKDGTWQWAMSGEPLYTYAADQKPGDMMGDGVGGVWHLAQQP